MVAEEFLIASEQSTQDGREFISCLVILMQMPDYLYSVCRNNTKIWNNSELNLLHTYNSSLLAFFFE